MKNPMNAVNGVQSWIETHHEVVSFITSYLEGYEEHRDYEDEIFDTQDQVGTYGLYELAINWTNEFEEKHKDSKWSEDDYWDHTEAFFKAKTQRLTDED